MQALNYFVAQKYVEAMQQIGASPNSRLVLMPMETGGLVGTIAGIAELARIAAALRSSRHERRFFGGHAVVGLDCLGRVLALAEMAAAQLVSDVDRARAAITGIAAAATGMMFEGQLAIFAVATALSCIAGYFVYRAIERIATAKFRSTAAAIDDRHARDGMRGVFRRARQGADRRYRVARRRARSRRGNPRWSSRASAAPGSR